MFEEGVFSGTYSTCFYVMVHNVIVTWDECCPLSEVEYCMNSLIHSPLPLAVRIWNGA